jgi:hypothetical protein
MIFYLVYQEEQTVLSASLSERQLSYSHLKKIGEMPHIFSHINMKYVVYTATYTGENSVHCTIGQMKKICAMPRIFSHINMTYVVYTATFIQYR